jgi:hypothetical protein
MPAGVTDRVVELDDRPARIGVALEGFQRQGELIDGAVPAPLRGP